MFSKGLTDGESLTNLQGTQLPIAVGGSKYMYVTECICTLCLCCCTLYVTLSVGVISSFFFSWVWGKVDYDVIYRPLACTFMIFQGMNFIMRIRNYKKYTHGHTHTHTYTRPHANVHTHTHTHERTHASTHARTHARTHTHTHTRWSEKI